MGVCVCVSTVYGYMVHCMMYLHMYAWFVCVPMPLYADVVHFPLNLFMLVYKTALHVCLFPQSVHVVLKDVGFTI